MTVFGNREAHRRRNGSLPPGLLMACCLLLPAVLVGANRVSWDLFSVYYSRFLATNNGSFLNPGEMFDLETYHSNLKLNLECRLKLGRARFLVSPLIDIDQDSECNIKLREFNCNISLGNFEITFGKSLISLGTGYVFTPISVITPELQVSDPRDTFRENQGVDLLKIDYYTERLNLSAMVFRKTNWTNVALLVYYGFTGFDLYGILYLPEYKKLAYGLACSTRIGDAVEAHTEMMFQAQAPIRYHQVFFEPDPQVTFSDDPLRAAPEKTYVEFVAGVNITLKGGINLIAEYVHKDWGLKPAWWDKLAAHYCYNLEYIEEPLSEMNITAAQQIVNQERRGLLRDYLFLRLWKTLDKSDISAITYTNLHDLSTTLILRWESRVSPGVILFIHPIFFIGKEGTEFKEFWYSHMIQLGLRAKF